MGIVNNKHHIEGYIYRADTSHRVEGSFTTYVKNDALWAKVSTIDGHIISEDLLEALEIEAPLGKIMRKLYFSDGTLFETDNHDAIRHLTGRRKTDILHTYERFHPRLLGVVALCFGLIFVLWRYGLDILVSIALYFTPPILVQQIDTATLQVIDYTMATPSKLSEMQKNEVIEIYEKLVSVLPEKINKHYDFNLQFRNIKDIGPNAFALPGGTVVMTDEFIKLFSDPDIQANVIGHELGHVVENHALRSLYRALGLYVLIAYLMGDTGPILENIILEGNVLLSLSHSRDQETSADSFGIDLAKRAGFNSEGLVHFFEQLEKEYPDSDAIEWYSTHPSHANRIEQLKQQLQISE